MTMNEIIDGERFILVLDGRLDATTAPQLEKALENLDEIKELIMDFGDLEYISSAGLRVILNAQKQMERQGDMVIINVNEEIMDILEVTGVANILKIEYN